MLTITKQQIAILIILGVSIIGLLSTLRADMSDEVDQEIQQEESQQEQLINDQLGGYHTEEQNMQDNTEFQDFKNSQPGFNR